jgi:hypothetical protein
MNRPHSPSHRTDLLLLLGALAGTSAALGLALALASTAAILVIAESASAALGAFWWAGGFVVVGMCGLPLAYWAGRALVGRTPVGAGRPSAMWGWMAVLFPPSIGLGYLAFVRGWLPTILGPLAQILAAGIPVALVALVARRQGPRISPRRAWAQFMLGLWGAPAAALVLETLLLIPVAILLTAGLTAVPEGLDLIEGLLEARKSTLQASLPGGLLREQPWILLIVLSFAAVLVPLVEELFKTMAIWPLLRRRIAESEAFMGGVLGGAGYALFEALFLAQPGADWGVTMVSRVGTTLMHAFTAGVAAWGLASAFSRRRPLRFVWAYLTSAALHGAWNATVIGISAAGILFPPARTQGVAPTVGLALLGSLSLLALGGIVWMGRRLNRTADREGPAGVEPRVPG